MGAVGRPSREKISCARESTGVLVHSHIYRSGMLTDTETSHIAGP
jgi:hypothetical protein